MAAPVSFSRWFGLVRMSILWSGARFGFGLVRMSILRSGARFGFTRLAQPTIEFVLIFRVIHRQFEDLDAAIVGRLLGFLAHRTPRKVNSRR